MSPVLTRLRRAWDEWLDASPVPPLRKPTVLQFPINDICNSRCQMCRIWERKRDEEISPDQLGRILSDPLFTHIENVGLNGGEPTLRSDLTRLAEVLMDRLPRLRALSLITNAIREKRVIAAVEELGALCRRRGKHLDVMVSLDGVGDVHDRVRGVPGNFESSVKVLDYLKTSTVVDSYRIGCTIIAENAFDVENVLAWAKAHDVYARFRLGVPHPRLYSAQLTDPFALGPEAIFHVAAFLETLILDYEKSEARRAFYRSLRDQMTEGLSRAAGCAWRNHGATLGPRGELSYCAVASPVLGNANQVDASRLYWGGKEILDGILKDKCAGCRHDYEGIGQRRVLLKVWGKRLAEKLPGPMLKPLRGAWRELGDRRLARVKLGGRQAGTLRTSTEVPRVLLSGWYGTETLGDRAILAGLCGMLHEAFPQAVIEVASLNPYVTRETCRLMPELEIVRVLDLPAAMREAAGGRYHAVAVAGGPLMTPVREVIDLKNLLQVAKTAGARTALLGCGLGPIAGRGPRNSSIGWMVANVDVCVLRDAASVEVARRRFGRTGAICHAVDPAFFWVAAQPEADARKTGDGITVALALREWMTAEYALGLSSARAQALKERFEAELRRMVRRLRKASPAVNVVPVCMHTLAQGGDDRWFYHGLLGEDPGMQALISWKRKTPRQELALLQGAHGVVAMRFHSAVFALALGKPMLALDYTRGGKMAALLKETGNVDRLIDLESFDGEKAAERLLADIAAGEKPCAVDLAGARKIYADALHDLLLVPQTFR